MAGTIIHTIEGNSGKVVTRRTYRVGEGCIRGYARPKYDIERGEAAATTYVNMRSWAGLEYPNIKSWPTLREGNLVDVCDTIHDRYGNPWMYVRIDGRVYGFVKGEFLKRV